MDSYFYGYTKRHKITLHSDNESFYKLPMKVYYIWL